MAVILPSSFTVGETVRLWAKDPENEKWCTVVAPDAREFNMKAATNGSVDVWLAQSGTWHYFWSEGDHGMLKVLPAPEDEIQIYEVIEGG